MVHAVQPVVVKVAVPPTDGVVVPVQSMQAPFAGLKAQAPEHPPATQVVLDKQTLHPVGQAVAQLDDWFVKTNPVLHDVHKFTVPVRPETEAQPVTEKVEPGAVWVKAK